MPGEAWLISTRVLSRSTLVTAQRYSKLLTPVLYWARIVQSSPPASHVFSLVQQQVHGTQHKRLLLPWKVAKANAGNGNELGLQGKRFTTGWVEGSPAGRVGAWHPEVSETKYQRSSENLLTQGHRLRDTDGKCMTKQRGPCGFRLCWTQVQGHM